ncbi:hypothetical protein [Pseudocnuella soli]|uniref:hypothetical protein n=1 Tax=Pseudocnuella soli TaxID=2502779 RepID=UPI00104C390A|nr:hypothetical protein [Pseudocnuella soli]
MDEGFEISVPYKNGEILVPVKLLPQGFSYKIEATVNGTVVWFEPDEERNFRAVLPPEGDTTAHPPDAALLQAIATALEEALR